MPTKNFFAPNVAFENWVSREIGRLEELLKQPRERYFLIANVIGAVLYVILSANGWRIPEENGEIPVTGEPFVWFGSIAPVVALFFLLNLIWAALILRSRHWRSAFVWTLAAVLWSVAILIDFAHH